MGSHLTTEIDSLANIVANTIKYAHIMPVIKTFHWFPIKHRTVCKTALLVYKFLQNDYVKILNFSLNPDTEPVEVNLIPCC